MASMDMLPDDAAAYIVKHHDCPPDHESCLYECVICRRDIAAEDSGLCDDHKYDEQLAARGCRPERHALEGACYMCCPACNYVQHRCHLCGTDLTHNSYEDAACTVRHWLSDCRPDLIDGSYDGTRHKDGPMTGHRHEPVRVA